MVPRAVVIMDALPMGPTGKLDVDALPSPPQSSTVDSVGTTLDTMEATIAATWREVLGLDGIDRQASFIELGGHSLQLALVQQRLEKLLGIEVPIARLIEFPSVAGLAEHLRAGPPVVDPAVARASERMRRRREARR